MEEVRDLENVLLWKVKNANPGRHNTMPRKKYSVRPT
jgi:hypothetical protein